MAAENNLIKKNDMSTAQVREQEFALLFEGDLRKLTEAIGVTRKVAKTAGTVLKTYKATGTLQSGSVSEGDIIPLSKYKVEGTAVGELNIKKWRKATSAENIIEYGFDQAVTMTTDKMEKDVAKGIRRDFFTFLATGTGSASGSSLQAALADAWGQLQVLFEDTDSTPVYFINPLDIANYLGSASITTQNAFGMRYIEDFLGLGTVFMNSDVPQGTIYATARDNIVLYYIPVNGADLGEAFDFTSDPTGYVGIHEIPDYDNLTCKDTVVCGIALFAEMLDGVVVGSITSPASSEARLASLAIGTLELTPEFNRNTITYAAATTASTNKITAVALDDNATIEILNGDSAVTNGQSASWSAGENTVKVTVTAEDGTTTKVYTVTVTKS